VVDQAAPREARPEAAMILELVWTITSQNE